MPRMQKGALLSLGAALAFCLSAGCAARQEPTPVVVNVSPACPSSGAPQAASVDTDGSAVTSTAGYEAGTIRPAALPAGQVFQQTDEASFFNVQVHDVALQLLKNFAAEGPGAPMAVATFVDLNSLYRTSPFGRYVSEQLMGEMQRAGFKVLEVRKTDSLLMKEHFGEYSLSRDVEEIAGQCSAKYILVGTYVSRGRYILLNARLVSGDGGVVVSSAMKILRRDPFLDRMLWPEAAPETRPAVRLPVKSLGEPTQVRIISGS